MRRRHRRTWPAETPLSAAIVFTVAPNVRRRSASITSRSLRVSQKQTAAHRGHGGSGCRPTQNCRHRPNGKHRQGSRLPPRPLQISCHGRTPDPEPDQKETPPIGANGLSETAAEETAAAASPQTAPARVKPAAAG